MKSYYYDKYFETYTKIYNLSVAHDNLMKVGINWRFLDEMVEEYIDHAIDRKEMDKTEAENFRQGWRYFIDTMFN